MVRYKLDEMRQKASNGLTKKRERLKFNPQTHVIVFFTKYQTLY